MTHSYKLYREFFSDDLTSRLDDLGRFDNLASAKSAADNTVDDDLRWLSVSDHRWESTRWGAWFIIEEEQ